MDDAAVGKAVFQQVVLHDGVVAVGVHAQVALVGGAVVHHTVEYAVCLGGAGYAVHHVVGQGVVGPLALIYIIIGGIGRWQKGEIGYYGTVVLYQG